MYGYALQLGIKDFWDLSPFEFNNLAKGERDRLDRTSNERRIVGAVIVQSFIGKKVDPKKIFRIPSIDNRPVKPKSSYSQFVKALDKLNLKRGKFREISSKT